MSSLVKVWPIQNREETAGRDLTRAEPDNAGDPLQKGRSVGRLYDGEGAVHRLHHAEVLLQVPLRLRRKDDLAPSLGEGCLETPHRRRGQQSQPL